MSLFCKYRANQTVPQKQWCISIFVPNAITIPLTICSLNKNKSWTQPELNWGTVNILPLRPSRKPPNHMQNNTWFSRITHSLTRKIHNVLISEEKSVQWIQVIKLCERIRAIHRKLPFVCLVCPLWLTSDILILDISLHRFNWFFLRQICMHKKTNLINVLLLLQFNMTF